MDRVIKGYCRALEWLMVAALGMMVVLVYAVPVAIFDCQKLQDALSIPP